MILRRARGSSSSKLHLSDDEHSIHSDDTVLSTMKENKLIQCGACFRSFHTQAQFGQHSRICREGKVVIRHLIESEEYKYAFLEKQSKQKLEVKSRFVIDIADQENWKKISRKTGLYDGGIKKMLHSKDIKNVDVAIRQRRASGLIIANFIVRNVTQNAKAIHAAKSSIECAVDAVYHQLPNNISMRLHLCKTNNCKELVIRDTEGFCSRHRAQKYHKKTHKVYKKEIKSIKRKTSLVQTDNVNNITICDDEMTEDDELVAQILTNLRATYTQHSKKRKKESSMDTPPTKKAKLDNNTPIYMVPITMIPMQPIAIPYAFVPMIPTLNIDLMNILNGINCNNDITKLPPIASFSNDDI